MGYFEARLDVLFDFVLQGPCVTEFAFIEHAGQECMHRQTAGRGGREVEDEKWLRA